MGVVVGEVEHGEVLFAVTFDFHFYLWDFKGLSNGVLKIYHFKGLSMALTLAICGTYIGYLWDLHWLSVALALAICGTYMSYLWQLRGAIAKVELLG